MNDDEEIIKNLELLEAMYLLTTDKNLEMMKKLNEFESDDDLDSSLDNDLDVELKEEGK